MTGTTEQPIHMIPSDQNAYGGIRERVQAYITKDERHRDRIPFLFLENWEGTLPETPPKWVSSAPRIEKLWKIAEYLAEMYRFWLKRQYEDPPSISEYIESLHDSCKEEPPRQAFPDEKLAHSVREGKEHGQPGYEHVKKWREKMETFQRALRTEKHERANDERED